MEVGSNWLLRSRSLCSPPQIKISTARSRTRCLIHHLLFEDTPSARSTAKPGFSVRDARTGACTPKDGVPRRRPGLEKTHH